MHRQETKHLEDHTENYTMGGFHPCYLGEIIGERYRIQRKISMTKYCSVWYAQDLTHKIYVTIKIFKATQSYYEIAMEEVEKQQFMYTQSQSLQWKKMSEKFRESLGLDIQAPLNETFCAKLF